MANTKEGDLKTYLGRMWPRFAATGLEPGTRGRRYYDRCEAIQAGMEVAGTREFIAGIKHAIVYDPRRYPTEPQVWVRYGAVNAPMPVTVAFVAAVFWQRGRRVRVRDASGKCLVVKADQVYPSREALEKAARKGG
jgi:hypothetical protein